MAATGSVSGESRRRLQEYCSDDDGPLFAVSDEGSASLAVVEAAYSSAKAAARPEFPADPLRLGVILDGERMTSAGETPIGPPEYRALRAAAAGRLLLTTNVGTRVNVRLAGQLPEFPARVDSAEAVASAFQPFMQTPDGRPRPLTARLQVVPDGGIAGLVALVERLERLRSDGRIGPASIHRLSPLVAFEEAIESESQLARIEAVIAAAADLGLGELAIDGAPLAYARRRVSAPGLLEILTVEQLGRLLGAARARGLRLVPRHRFDIEATARTIWTGLEAARTQGFNGGKYGLFPLTLEEQKQVIELISRWSGEWTPIPAFYVDTPLVTEEEVFGLDRCEPAARRWLRAARDAGATLALFDAPDRVAPRKLVQGADGGDGALTVDQIEQLSRYGELLGIRIMWSGGITAPQALDLARRRVFAIFSTSSTAVKVPVSAKFDRDPRLAAENEPEISGIRRMHAIIQAGFLSTRLEAPDADLAHALETGAVSLAGGGLGQAEGAAALADLDRLLVDGWRRIDAGSPAAPVASKARERAGGAPRPVPPAAVRVFRGRKRREDSRGLFVQRLETVFMPMTVQMQRLYGLTAYLPAVLPDGAGDAIPDEVALVFYRTQEAYHEAKRCIGGRAYSELHELAFDMAASRSGFPDFLEGDAIDPDRPYHLFERPVDWQAGGTRLFVGRRRPDLEPAAFLAGAGDAVREVRAAPAGLDAAIFLANEEMLLWWDHAPAPLEEEVGFFADIAEGVHAGAPRALHVPTDLTEPYAGLSLNEDGDFLNFQFPRL